MRDGDLGMARTMAPRLAALLQMAPGDRAAMWQDSLDLLAVAAGIKHGALIGCGYEGGAWLDLVADLAEASGLCVARGGMPWIIADELAGLPDWYVGPLQESWAEADMLFVARTGATLPRHVLRQAEEAELLSYPSCCVAAHHARRRGYYQLMVELIEAHCESETERRRFAESELPPPLRGESDHRRLAEALDAPALAYVGFDLCPACVALGPRGPAGQIATRYRALAESLGFAALADCEA